MSAVARTSRVASVAAVAFGVLTLAVGQATVPLDSAIHQSGLGGPVVDLLFTAAVMVPAAGVGTLLAAVARPTPWAGSCS